jgi:ABC-2 type transport system ATP-binding protein
VTAIIQFDGLSKTYSQGFLGRKQTAVEALSLSVPKGSIYGFLGANGAGKTTCIKIMMGLQFATLGRVSLFGEDPLLPSVKQRVGYLPERPYFHDSMTIEKFLNFHRRLFGGAKTLSNEALLQLVSLSDVAGKSLRSYSKGMLQRAGIAQALVNDPELVVLDEPMSGLDPVGRREMRDLILKLNSMGKTVFFSSHILSDVEQICHRIAFLERGKLRHEGSLQEILGGSSGYELAFRGSLDGLFGARPTRKVGADTFVHCHSTDEANALIKAAWEKGGTLLSFQREQRSLEDFLFGSREAK